MARRYLVTSALPYANGPLHLGHLAGAYLPADVYVRFLRMRGEDVVFVCGTDEHGVAITIAAEREGKTPRELVDVYHSVIRKDFEDFGVSFDNFSRTTLPHHYDFAQKVFLALLDKGHISEKSIQQLYCGRCQRFLPDRYIDGTCPKCGSTSARGDQCEDCGSWLDALELVDARCSICGSAPEPRGTRHWFLKLDSFQDWISGFLETREGWRENVLNYCRGWLAEGLRERAITRDLDWGVPVPLEGAEGKVLYVWFENLLGYVSSTVEHFEKLGKPEAWKDYWKDPETRLVHFIGKDNIVFHAINFPIMLHALEDFALTWNVPANEFLNFGGQKQSTSRRTAIWMRDCILNLPADPFRYALTIGAPENRDTDFTWSEFRARNNELADVLGNFVNRTMKFAHRSFRGLVPAAGEPGAEESGLMETIRDIAASVGGKIAGFQIKAACSEAMEAARLCNRYFDRVSPWETVRSDPARCAVSLNTCLQAVDWLRQLFGPFLPFTAERIGRMLGRQRLDWSEIGSPMLQDGAGLGKPEILFEKLEEGFEAQLRTVEAEATSGGGPAAGKAPSQAATEDSGNTVAFEEFRKMDIRVALIEEVHRVEGADKLYRMVIDLGRLGRRQIVAGLRPYYRPEDLEGMKAAVITNLEPATIRGVRSEGMILASDGDTGVYLLEAGPEARPGDLVR
ncbi:methionine--tRNA ligase [Candidatus Fermentibacterales bacterium]|nr:methionine--tRNA ligase [Candidatus Fermentibacterales bacterium]